MKENFEHENDLQAQLRHSPSAQPLLSQQLALDAHWRGKKPERVVSPSLTFVAQSQKQGDGRRVGRELQVQSGALAEQPVLRDVIEVRVEDGGRQGAVAVAHHQPGKTFKTFELIGLL